MGRAFNFKADFGWSEAFSAFAVFVSVFTFFASRSATNPSFTLDELPPRAHIVCNPYTGTPDLIALAPIRVTNLGGRAASLIGFAPSGTDPAITGYSRDGSVVDVNPRLMLINSTALPKGVDSWSQDVAALLDNSDELVLEKVDHLRLNPSIVDIPFESGHTKLVVFGLRAMFSDRSEDGSAYRELDHLQVSALAVFSNAQEVPMQFRVEKPFTGRYGVRCSQPISSAPR